MAAEFIGQPVAFDALYDVVTRAAGVHLEPCAVRAGDWLEQQRIGEIDFTAQHLLVFGVIRPNTSPGADGHTRYDLTGRHFYFNPGPDLVPAARRRPHADRLPGQPVPVPGTGRQARRPTEMAQGETMTPRYALFGCNPLAIEVAWRLSMVKHALRHARPRCGAGGAGAAGRPVGRAHRLHRRRRPARGGHRRPHRRRVLPVYGRIRKTSSWPSPPARSIPRCASSPSARRRRPPPSCWPPAPTRWWIPTRSAARGCTN